MWFHLVKASLQNHELVADHLFAFSTHLLTTTYIVIIWLVNAFCVYPILHETNNFLLSDFFVKEQKCNFCLYKRKLEILTDRLLLYDTTTLCRAENNRPKGS